MTQQVATPSDLDKDHPLFSRYPGARIYGHQKVDYETLAMPISISGVGSDNFKVEKLSLTGDLSRHFYNIDHVSSLKVFENYKVALTSAGFKTSFECHLDNCGTVTQSSKLGGEMSHTGSVYNYYRKPYFIVANKEGPNGTVYVALYIAGYEDEVAVQQTIIETEPSETGLVQVNAEGLKRDLDEKGKASIYGILFDIDKATIKPESKSTLDEIAKLLKQHATLNIYVVGHTDDTGDLIHNINLSAERALAVKMALIKQYGIAENRLMTKGVGPFAPESNNTSNQGKTLNRRVELVKRLK